MENKKEEKDFAQDLYENKDEFKDFKKEIHPFSFWSFILSTSSIWGFFLFFIPFLNFIFFFFVFICFFVSLILGVLSFDKISQNKEKYTGVGFSVAGIILSSLQLVGMISSVIFFLRLYNIL